MVWSVRSLIEKAAALPIRDVPLTAIAELDEPYWGSAKAPLTVREVAEHADLIDAADVAYPILLCADGRVMDGMHRVANALRSGQASIPAQQFAETPPPDYRDVDLADLPYD